MKKLITLGCVFFFWLSVMAQQPQDALAYLTVISEQQKLISQNLWDYTCSVAQGKGAFKVENKRKDLLKTISSAKQKVKALDSYNSSAQLRDSTLSYLELSYNVIAQDYAKIVNMQEISEQSYDAMEAYLMAQEKANEKIDIAGDIFANEYALFASQNNITLLEDDSELSKKLGKASDVYKYYNPLYLIFFKSYKQELYLIDAMNKRDINAMEQNRQSLESFAQEGIAKINEIPAFKGDASMKNAALEVLKFYLIEAEKVSIAVDFFMKQEQMDNTKKSFDALSTKSQSDVDAFNKVVNETNKAMNDYNANNATMNEKRAKLLDKMNVTCGNFTKSHIPKR